MKPRSDHSGLPSRQQVLDFIAGSPTPAGKREIAREFGLKGQEKIALKALLRDMADEGLIDGEKRAFHRYGRGSESDGASRRRHRGWRGDRHSRQLVARPFGSGGAAPPPRLRMVEKGRHSALKPGDRVLARTEEAGAGWRAHPMKKLPAAADQLLGVVEIDAAGKGWLAPVDKRVRHSAPISDLGGAEPGQLVLAEPAGRSPRAGVKVTEVLGDPLAPRAFSLIAIHKHGIPNVFAEEALAEAKLAAKLPLSAEKREDLRHLPIVAIDPADARDHDDAIWAEPDEAEDNKGGFRALVAIADVSFYVRPGGAVDREARQRGNSVYFPDRVVPMLPEVLSADVCSLRAGEDRAAMACHLVIDAHGRVTDWRFTRAIVRIAEVIAYEDAQARIDTGEAGESLRNLWACWRALAKARDARDPLALELPERRVMLDEQGRIAEIALREPLDAHRVVEDFMIAANVAAAKALESKVAPVVYRIHEPPSREKLVALKDYLATFDMKLALGPGRHARSVQPHAQGRGRRGREGAGDGSGAAQPDPGLLRAAQCRPFRAGAGLICPFHLADPALFRFAGPPGAGRCISSRTTGAERKAWPRRRVCPNATARTSARSARRSAPPNAAPWRPSAKLSIAMSPPGSRRGSAKCSIRG